MCRSFSKLGYTSQQNKRNGDTNIIPTPLEQHHFEGLAGHPLNSRNPSSSLFNMALVSTDPTTPHCPDDISRGEEMVQISIERDTSHHEEYPPQFHYIARNIPYQNAYISISLARIGDESCCFDCFDDCLQKPYACACASETSGVFAYTKEGLLRSEFLDACMTMLREPNQSNYFYCKEGCPLERVKNDGQPEKCKGHLMRKFIKECWAKCGCKKQCGNRVVQRGIKCNLQVPFPNY
jgi:Pre-SET motif